MKKILFFVISSFVIFLSFIFLFSEKKEFSVNENRYLASAPKLSFKTIINGTFVSELETYITDYFPFRDFFVGMKTNFEILIGKSDIDDVYLGKDDYLLTKYKKIDSEKLVQVINNFNKINSEKNINLMLIPSSISIYSDKLPNYAITDSEIDSINDIYAKTTTKNLNISDDLKKIKNNVQVFYKTDHHYTTYGAYQAYVRYCIDNNINYLNINDFNVVKITDSFYGTLYSKTNKYNISPDDMYLFTTNTNYTVYYNDTKKETNSLYDYNYLNQKDKYSIFLSNNHSLITITNNSLNSNKELLVIKDSYGNSFVPFIAEHYKKVYVVDLRYNLNSMSEFLKENKKIKDIIIIYNINTIDNSSSIYFLR